MTGSASRSEHRSGSAVLTEVANWERSVGLTACAAVAIVVAAVGLIAARLDVALLAVPLVAAAVLSWERRPSSTEAATGRLRLADPGGGEVGFTLSLAPPAGVEMIVLRYSILAGEARELVFAGPLAGNLAGRVPLLHSGPQELVRVEYRFLGADAGAISLPQGPLVADRVIAPQEATIRSLPLPRRLHGLTGSHESARAGDGGDFRDIHPFAAGDRLRRIDWRATARLGQNPGDLYVRRTAALADATVLIVVDSRDDVGEQVAEWSRNKAATKGISSLDVAREAASSIASGYIVAGDRVGFQDLSSRARIIAHACSLKGCVRTMVRPLPASPLCHALSSSLRSAGGGIRTRAASSDRSWCAWLIGRDQAPNAAATHARPFHRRLSFAQVAPRAALQPTGRSRSGGIIAK